MNKSKQPVESHQPNNRPKFNLFVSKPDTSRSNPSNSHSSNLINKSSNMVNRTQLINPIKVSNTSTQNIPIPKIPISRHSPDRSSTSLSSTTVVQQTSAGQSDAKHKCQLCDLHFNNIEQLNSHLIDIHKLNQRISYLQCYVRDCDKKFKKRLQLVEHLNNDHEMGVVVVVKMVRNLDDFIKWKEKLEHETGYRWIQNNKFFLNNRLRQSFICNRTATHGCRAFTISGVTTISGQSTFCLSSIKVVENEDGKFSIEFIETHNHDDWFERD